MWNIINIIECERRSEIDSASANTTFGTTIRINTIEGGEDIV